MKTIKFFCVLVFAALLSVISLSGQTVNSSTFNVMSYNIRLNTAGDGINAWPVRKDKLMGLIRFHKPDLFGVQEAVSLQMTDLDSYFPEFDYVGVGRDDGKLAGEFMAIFYRKDRFEK